MSLTQVKLTCVRVSGQWWQMHKVQYTQEHGPANLAVVTLQASAAHWAERTQHVDVTVCMHAHVPVEL
jgi:hypothetical protein